MSRNWTLAAASAPSTVGTDIGGVGSNMNLAKLLAAKKALDGMLKNEEVIVPGFINKCLLLLDKIMPQCLKDIITAREIQKFNTQKIKNYTT